MDRLKSQNSQPESQPDESTQGSITDAQTLPTANSGISPNCAVPILPSQQVQPGETLGKYEVIHEIGRGGMSIVYKARDHDLNRLVAIKLLISKSSNEGHNILRFQQEARAASKLEHPNIVKIHDFSTTDDGTPYLVMSYLNGISLAEAIKNEGNFSLGRWLSVFVQACKALEHAHLAGVVHRDVKPSNFVLAKENGTEVLKLVDFGIAKNTTDDLGLTKVGEVFGSPLYMSPEQCAGATLDTRSDIYSLGCVMYEALAGKPPISGENSLHTLQAHLTDKPERLSKLNLKTKNIQKLDRIVMRCLEKKPENRYQNLGELRNELELLLQDQNIDAPKNSAINIPIVVASTIGCLAIFAAFLAFDRLDNQRRTSPQAPKSSAEADSRSSTELPKKAADTPTSKDIARKRDELTDLELRLARLRSERLFNKAFEVATRTSALAKELNAPPFEQAHILVQQSELEQHLHLPKARAEHIRESVGLMKNPQTPGEYESKYQTLMAYGDILKEREQNLKAEAIYQQAAAVAGEQKNATHQSASLIYMGMCEQANNNDRECLKYWKQARELNPEDTSLQKNIDDLERKLQ